MSEIHAIFFDFGDTLAELSPSKEKLFIACARTIGLELDLEAVRRAYHIVDSQKKYSSVVKPDWDRFYQAYNEHLCEALGISSHSKPLVPALLERFRNDRHWVLIDDAAETLLRLRSRGIPLALVSNWDANLITLTERLGIREHFAAIVPSMIAGVEKPDPAIFRRAADEFSLSMESGRILYVGNEYRADVVGARDAGLAPVLIDRANLYPHADCPRFSSLRDWLESLN